MITSNPDFIPTNNLLSSCNFSSAFFLRICKRKYVVLLTQPLIEDPDLLVRDVLLQYLEFLPQLGVLLLAHELDQLPLRLELLLDRPEVTNLLLGSVLKLLEMLSSVLLCLKSTEKLDCKAVLRY